MPHTGHLDSVLVILLAALISVPLMQRIRVSPVLGYLLAGVLIGPHGLALVQESANTELLAEFGVIFLLFSIGLELPFRRLRAMRRYILGLGLTQVVLTGLVIGAVAFFVLGRKPETALVVGGALALSSTATVLQILVERREVAEQHGRMSIGVLLFQDLAVVPLLAILPILAGGGTNIGGALALAGVKAVAAVAIILVIGRLLIRPIYRLMAGTRNAEIFAATNLFLVLFTGWATAQAGMSMALGAFLAGLLLADSEFRHQVEADIQPFRGLFLGLFFMTVGMGLDLERVAGAAGPVLGLTVALLAVKATILFAILRTLRYPARVSGRVALLLAQGGEFAFVILGLAMQLGVIPDEVVQTLLPAVAISMATTPLFAALGKRLQDRGAVPETPDSDLAKAGDHLSDHVVVVGFGRVGWTVCKVLARSNIPYVALDADPARVERGRAEGMPVYFGDASRLEVLRAAGLDQARAAVITLDQPGLAEAATAAVRRHDPKLPVISRARDGDHRKRLEDHGASAVVSEAVEASLQLGAQILRLSGTAGEQIEQILDAFRHDDYALLDDLLAERAASASPRPDSLGWLPRRLRRRGARQR